MHTSRRSVLKMFGVTAVVAPIAGAAEIVEAGPSVFTLPLKPPEGMTYNWKRVFIDRDTPDFENIVEMVKLGWKPVPMARHRNFLPAINGAYWIEEGGLVLMEKPTGDIPPPRKFELGGDDAA